MTVTLEHPSISRGTAPIDAFKVDAMGDDGRVLTIDVEGRKVQPTDRFWRSLWSRFGLGPQVLKYWSPQETFERIKKVKGDSARLRYTIEDNAQDGKLLAVAAPNKPLVEIEQAAQTIGRYAVSDMHYADGIIHSTHQPPRIEGFNIGPDKFVNQYCMETPIDGYGKPATWLSVLRLVCANGMIGYSKAFRSEVQIGNTSDSDAMFTIARLLDSWNNEEGYAALQERFEEAADAYASLYECNRIYRAINKLSAQNAFHDGKSELVDGLVRKQIAGGDGASAIDNDTLSLRIIRAYTECTGDICKTYGLAHLDALTQKSMQRLHAKCTVYDLLNLASEVATHYTTPDRGRVLQSEIGQLVSDEYDLPGTKKEYPNYQDLFIERDGKEMVQAAKN